jgi:DNA-binding response OmpR family regulator
MPNHLTCDAIGGRNATGPWSDDRGSSATILVIDDDPAVRWFLKDSLAEWGGRVETAVNGAEGLRAFRACRPALVLTDLLMPGVTGLEVIRTIRSLDDRVPVVLVTGQAAFQKSAVAHRYGFTAVLSKPFGLNELEAVVTPLLSRLAPAEAD